MQHTFRFFLVLTSLVSLFAKAGQADVTAFLENPVQDQKVSGIGVVSGWAFSSVPGAQVTVRLRIDGTNTTDVPCCVERADVAQQFGPQALRSGFGQVVNFNLLSAESHKVAVEVTDNAGSPTKTLEYTVTVIKPGGFAFLSLLDLALASADRQDQEIVLEEARAREKGTSNDQEVTVRLAWQQNTQTLGIVKAENTGPAVGGQSSQGLDSAQAQTVAASGGGQSAQGGDYTPVQAAATADAAVRVELENPADAQAVSGIGIVSGWTFSQTPGGTINAVRLRIDGTPAFTIPCCSDRADVAQAFPEQAQQAQRSGFATPVNFNTLPTGSHTIGVEVQDGTGASHLVDHQVTAVRLGGFEFLDLFDLSNATAGIGGQTLVLEKVQIRDKASQQTREVNAHYAWQESCQCFVAQAVCGNGGVEPTEECDGVALGGETCDSLGFSGGTLACSATCEFETKDCLGGPRLYVTNVLSNTVSELSTATHLVTNTLPVGKEPRGIALSPDGAVAYVTNFADDTVSVISTATSQVTDTIPLRAGGGEKGPLGVAFAPDGTRAYVVNGFEHTVSVVGVVTKSVLATVPVGREPQAIALTPDGTRAYVTNFADNSVTVLDTGSNAPVATVAVGAGPDGVAVTPDGTKVYVANFDGDSVSVIDTATNTAGEPLPVSFRPAKVAFSPDGKRAYVTNSLGDTISVIDPATDTLVTSFPAADAPDGIVITPNGKRAYVALFGANGGGRAVQVVSTVTNATLAVSLVGKGPFAVAVTPPRP